MAKKNQKTTPAMLTANEIQSISAGKAIRRKISPTDKLHITILELMQKDLTHAISQSGKMKKKKKKPVKGTPDSKSTKAISGKTTKRKGHSKLLTIPIKNKAGGSTNYTRTRMGATSQRKEKGEKGETQ
ncbi:hypothetical protein CHS0354_030983 [Potamilus streckersoni]|uniref:Uncharacterized protein n=1 Tax=Potamilus streckersoni TaxID=2493646 RepID=A0AAE0VU39_9BIVA|nr:hypothetical protein CHS0354_030983 [Potamilus streckersoni]